jgi:hypothetical protein
MSIKLIAVDVDETLLDTKGDIPQTALAYVQKAVAQDIFVVLTTGRPLCAIRDYIAQLNLDHPSITSGGSYIFDPALERSIVDDPLPDEETIFIVEQARAYGVGIFFENPECILHESLPGAMDSTPPSLRKLIRLVEDLLDLDPLKAYKITLVAPDDKLTSLRAVLEQHRSKLHITTAHATYLEVTKTGVNKGSALKHLVRHLSLPLADVLAIGDSCNDVSMFEVAGTSIAVENANPEVQARAHAVAPSHEDGGVAWAIREFVLKER